MRPSMKVREGDVVKKVKYFLKTKNPGVIFTAPASGTITAINRGEKRVLQSVVINVEGDEKITFAKYSTEQLNTLSSEQVKQNLIESAYGRHYVLVHLVKFHPLKVNHLLFL